MSAIEAKHQRLMRDPIVVAMAEELGDMPLSQITALGGGPTFDFMKMANREYASRGGKDGGHIGAVAEAVIGLRQERDCG